MNLRCRRRPTWVCVKCRPSMTSPSPRWTTPCSDTHDDNAAVRAAATAPQPRRPVNDDDDDDDDDWVIDWFCIVQFIAVDAVPRASWGRLRGNRRACSRSPCIRTRAWRQTQTPRGSSCSLCICGVIAAVESYETAHENKTPKTKLLTLCISWHDEHTHCTTCDSTDRCEQTRRPAANSRRTRTRGWPRCFAAHRWDEWRRATHPAPWRCSSPHAFPRRPTAFSHDDVCAVCCLPAVLPTTTTIYLRHYHHHHHHHHHRRRHHLFLHHKEILFHTWKKKT